MKLRQFLDHGATALLILPEPQQLSDLLDTEAQAACSLYKSQAMQLLLVIQAIASRAALGGAEKAYAFVMANHAWGQLAGFCCLADIHTRCHGFFSGAQRLSSNALDTTLTLLNAIIAPASIGLSKPTAASGMPTLL